MNNVVPIIPIKSPANDGHPHHGYYRVNKVSTKWNQTRYRILSTSLGTMMALRDSSDNPDAITAYTKAIQSIREEMSHL